MHQARAFFLTLEVQFIHIEVMRSIAMPLTADDADKYRRRNSQGSQRATSALLALLIAGSCLALLVALAHWWFSTSSPSTLPFDAIIVPGGGLDGNGLPLPWVQARLDAAMAHDAETAVYLVLSRGTTHKPAPLTADGFAIDEAAASARYLIERGVAPERVLLESWSLDTIGNFAFARLMHADLRMWRRMLVVTSSIHMPRTKAICEWVFSLPDRGGGRRRPTAQLVYEEAPERGLDAIQVQDRRQKEVQSLKSLQSTIAAVPDLAELHAFLFVRHGAYRAPHAATDAARVEDRAKGALAGTY